MEYALLVAGVAAGLLLVVLALGGLSRSSFGDQCSRFGTANAINADVDINAARNC